jgi:hypothetical protein
VPGRAAARAGASAVPLVPFAGPAGGPLAGS